MEYKKNDLLTVTIEDMGHDGEGIGKVDGYTVFVKDTVIGDKVQAKIMKAKKNYGYARLVEIMEPSKDRVEPRCAYALSLIHISEPTRPNNRSRMPSSA